MVNAPLYLGDWYSSKLIGKYRKELHQLANMDAICYVCPDDTASTAVMMMNLSAGVMSGASCFCYSVK